MESMPQYIRQTDQILYPKVLYNRPITRSNGGQLLLVGGHAGEFSLPTIIHQLSLAAGVGECSVVLPDVLAKFLSGAPGTHFGSSNPSGSLAPEALGRILELSEEMDAIGIGASLSNNSTTAILVEKLISKATRNLIVFDDAIDIIQTNVVAVTENPHALVILTMAQVFKLCGKLNIPIHIRPDAGLINKLEIIQNLAAASHCSYAVYGTEIIIAAEHQLIVTPINYRLSLVPGLFPAVLGTFWLQNLTNPVAGLATGSYLIRQTGLDISPTDTPTPGKLARKLDEILRQDDF